MRRLTVVVGTSDSALREQILRLLSARNYRVVQASLLQGFADLYGTEPHDLAVIGLDETAAALAAYRAYRAATSNRPLKAVVIGGGDPGAEAAQAFDDIHLPALGRERDELLHAIEAATRPLITILIADDEPLIRKMFTAFLSGPPYGYHVVTAEDGADALQKVKEVLPDLVVTDIVMPHLDGYQLCRAIKENRDTVHIPVWIVSSLGAELDFDRGFNAGANEYFQKPLTLTLFAERVQETFRAIAMRGREKMLVVAPSPTERSLLKWGLEQQGFQVEVASDGEQAIEVATRLRPSLVVTDYDVTPLSSHTTFDAACLRERLRAERATRDVQMVVVVKQDHKLPQDRSKIDAAAWITRPYSAERLVAVIERILGERRVRMEGDRDAMLQAIQLTVKLLELKDPYTHGHSEKVAGYSVLIGRRVYESEEDLKRLQLSAQLHDIGKVAVPDAVLQKPGKLTDEEMDKMKIHPMKGVEILSIVPSLQDIVPGVRSHHERLDGKGYPDGLKGLEIPLQARIIAVGDTYDALTSDRPYRRGCSREKAFDILRAAAGDQLDPALVDIFIRAMSQFTAPERVALEAR